MLFGSPLRAAISRNGRASPDERNADSSCEAWTTAFTRYGSRRAGLSDLGSVLLISLRVAAIMAQRFAQRNSVGAPCSVLSAQCVVLSAQCSVLRALSTPAPSTQHPDYVAEGGAAVLARLINMWGSVTDSGVIASSWRIASSRRTVPSPISRIGCAIVVKAGSV